MIGEKIRAHADKIITPPLTSLLLGLITVAGMDSKFNYLASFLSQVIVISIMYYITYKASVKLSSSLKEHDSDSFKLIEDAIEKSTRTMELDIITNGTLDENNKKYHDALIKERNEMTLDNIIKRKEEKRVMEKKKSDLDSEAQSLGMKINNQIDSIAGKLEDNNNKA